MLKKYKDFIKIMARQKSRVNRYYRPFFCIPRSFHLYLFIKACSIGIIFSTLYLFRIAMLMLCFFHNPSQGGSGLQGIPRDPGILACRITDTGWMGY